MLQSTSTDNGASSHALEPPPLYVLKMKYLVQTRCVPPSFAAGLLSHQLAYRHNPHSDQVPQRSTHLFSQLSHSFPIDDLSSMWGRDRRLYNSPIPDDLWCSRLVEGQNGWSFAYGANRPGCGLSSSLNSCVPTGMLLKLTGSVFPSLQSIPIYLFLALLENITE